MVYRFKLERDELEERLGGGIPEGALVVVEGEYGAGKSIVTERLVYGFLSNHLKVSLVSTELTTLHFIEQMYSLDYPVEEHILDRTLLFLPVYPILGFRGKKGDLMDRLVGAKKMYESDVVVIDAFSTMLKHWMKSLPDDKDPMPKVEDALYLFKLLNAKGKTVVLTMETGVVDEEIASLLKAAADVYFSLKIDIVGNNVSRVIFVRRFERAEKAVGDMINFRVEPKAGLIVEIKSVS